MGVRKTAGLTSPPDPSYHGLAPLVQGTVRWSTSCSTPTFPHHLRVIGSGRGPNLPWLLPCPTLLPPLPSSRLLLPQTDSHQQIAPTASRAPNLRYIPVWLPQRGTLNPQAVSESYHNSITYHRPVVFLPNITTTVKYG